MKVLEKTRDEVISEAFNATKDLRRCSVNIVMGVGKTLLGLIHMNHIYTEESIFLVVAPKLSIFNTWKEEAKKHGYEHLLPHIQFSTYLSLKKQSIHYDCTYFDEFHNITEAHIGWLSSYNNKILGLTGTKPRSKSKIAIMELFFPIVYEYDINEAMANKILNKCFIKIHMLELSTDNSIKIETKTGKTWMTSELNSYNYWTNKIGELEDTDNVSYNDLKIFRILRMNALKNFKSKEIYAKELLKQSVNKTIVFANTTKQADSIYTYTYHSKNPNSKDNLKLFEENKITKLATVLQLVEGINVPNLKEAIILHAYGNGIKLFQRLGRLLRLNPEDSSIIHLLCYKNTADEMWIEDSLKDFDQTKIIKYDASNNN